MHKPPTFRLKADVVKPLSVRRDREGLWRALGHFGAIAVVAAAMTLTPMSGHFIWRAACTVALGYLLAFLFTAEHECAHQTAFKTRAFNYLVGHISGFVLLLPYENYRAFHWEHHRHTQDPERDPELLISTLPRSTTELVWHWSGLPFWWARARLLSKQGLLGRVTAPWVPEDKRPLIRREARCYLSGYALVLALSIVLHSAAALYFWIIPVMIGQLLLRPYLLAEHTGCANSSDMLENTRTTYTNGIIRYFAWNMPYHVEHHAYPSVPFHALPTLNGYLAPHIHNTNAGYVAATRSVIRFLWARCRRH